MEESKNQNKNDICSADQEHFGLWDDWYSCCFDKKGNYIEENEVIFAEIVKRHEQKMKQEHQKYQSQSSLNIPKKESDLSF